jgi:hypothetical protein
VQPDFKPTLSIEKLKFRDTGGPTYAPTGEGELRSESGAAQAKRWTYTAFTEPSTNMHPRPGVAIVQACGGQKVEVRVETVFRYLVDHGRQEDALHFTMSKYSFVIDSVPGGFHSIDVIWRCNLFQPRGTLACTDFATKDTSILRSTFADGENVLASVVVHEKVHTNGLGECEAYTMQVNTASQTGLDGQDWENPSFLKTFVRQMLHFC